MPRSPGELPGGAGLQYPIPAAAARAWEAHRGRPGQNPALIFDRFSPRWDDHGRRGSDREGEVKKQGLDAIRVAATRADAGLLAAWQGRWRADAAFVGAEPFTLTSDWRLITGLGRKGPLEVGFTFHRYGFPYLPASGLKGLARSAALFAIADTVGDSGLEAVTGWWRTRRVDRPPRGLAALTALLELEREKEKDFSETWAEALGGRAAAAGDLALSFRAVFGTTTAAGRAVFLDAVPDRLPKLDLDIMNPHVPDYYKEGLTGRTPPTNWQSPIPVYFLTVSPHTAFRFAVGWRGVADAEGTRRQALAQCWLVTGLTELGAGGKTGAGYGFFQPAAVTARADARATATSTPVTTSAGATPMAAPVAVDETTLEWRKGTVAEYQPGPGRGRLRDDATGTEYRFTREVIVDKGWSPARKGLVQFVIEERDGAAVVVRVRKPQR